MLGVEDGGQDVLIQLEGSANFLTTVHKKHNPLPKHESNARSMTA